MFNILLIFTSYLKDFCCIKLIFREHFFEFIPNFTFLIPVAQKPSPPPLGRPGESREPQGPLGSSRPQVGGGLFFLCSHGSVLKKLMAVNHKPHGPLGCTWALMGPMDPRGPHGPGAPLVSWAAWAYGRKRDARRGARSANKN